MTITTPAQGKENKLEYFMMQKEFLSRYPCFMEDVEKVVEIECNKGKHYVWLDLYKIDVKYLPFISNYLRKFPRKCLTRSFDGIRDGDQMAIELFWE
jgi:hypothetical protein